MSLVKWGENSQKRRPLRHFDWAAFPLSQCFGFQFLCLPRYRK